MGRTITGHPDPRIQNRTGNDKFSVRICIEFLLLMKHAIKKALEFTYSATVP